MTTHFPAQTPASRKDRSFRLFTIAVLLAAAFAPIAQAQAPAAASAVATAPSPAQLEKLVDRIALYPDDLVTIILPASTNPLQLVQADRYLDKRKKDPKLPLDDKWDDAVKSLLNYPDVVKMMSADLDWTSALGEAVVADQGAVLDAVQAFRRKTQAAGNLKTDAKQVVVVEKEVIKIVPADPQVIYVPQYNPTTVVVYGGYSSWGYYPTPYPVYYYPYPPGAALATGLIWGAAIGAAWNGGHYNTNWGGGNNDININRNTTINTGNINTGNINTGNRAGAGTPSQQPARGGSGSSQWKPNKQPGQVSNSVGKTPSGGRVGNASPSAGSGARPSTQPAGGGGGGAIGGGSRPSTQPAGGGRDYGGGRDSGGGAFGGSSASGRQTQMDSSRGAASRNSMSGGGASRAGGGYSGGGGARAGGGGGGGGRAGGGGGRGGGRR